MPSKSQCLVWERREYIPFPAIFPTIALFLYLTSLNTHADTKPEPVELGEIPIVQLAFREAYYCPCSSLAKNRGTVVLLRDYTSQHAELPSVPWENSVLYF